jgi:thiamine-monophosphate kinase
MALSEFALIARYFAALGSSRADVVLGVGDDGAILAPPRDSELVAVVDTLVEGVHFPVGSPPASIGHRAFAVNLSDLAAMGAEPAWALLALTLPDAEEQWLAEFARAAGDIARQHGVALVGGDTTSGPLSITVQLLGFAPRGTSLRRSGAAVGDGLFVSGTPGDAAAGLAIEQGKLVLADELHAGMLRDRFLFPTPRCAIGRELLGIASSCIDVSDGLGGDLEKLCVASGCGAEIEVNSLPLSDALRAAVGEPQAIDYCLTGGDDYELLFTIPQERWAQFAAKVSAGLGPVTRIGTIVQGSGVGLARPRGVTQFSHSGFDHFAH